MHCGIKLINKYQYLKNKIYKYYCLINFTLSVNSVFFTNRLLRFEECYKCASVQLSTTKHTYFSQGS